MMTAWILDAAGFLTGTYDGPGQPASSTRIQPPENAAQPLRFVDGAWLIAKPPGPPTVGPNEFYFLWTMQEQIAIDSLRETDPGIKLFMRRLDDPRTLEVVLADPTVQAAVSHTVDQLVGAGVIAEADAEARKAAIIAGPAR
jgi:hypothetical protein